MHLPQTGESTRSVAALERMVHLYESILESAGEGICALDAEGRFTFVNHAALELLGYSSDEMIGRSEHELLRRFERNGTQRPLRECSIAKAVRDGIAHRAVEDVFRRKDGAPLPVIYTASPVIKAGRVVGAVLIFRKAQESRKGEDEAFSSVARGIAERRRMEEQVAYYASHDPLTGLPNRRYFQEELRRQVVRANREGSCGALLIIDLDSFKDVNDSFGHRVGDTVLFDIAALLRSQVGERGLLARLGGDEFAVILPKAEREEALELASNILSAVNSHVIEWEGMRIGVTVSVGIALFPEHGANEEELMVHADAALFTAKENGRNDVALYCREEGDGEQLASRFAWDVTLREAIEAGRFALECQPITDLKANVIAHYELLLRLEGDEGYIMPAAFLETAERSGLIRTIDRYVIRKGIEVAAHLQRQGRQVGIAINLSGRSLGDFDLVDLVAGEIEKHGLDPSRLTFEITERMAVAGPKRAKEIISSLRRMGIRFALDDFGIGFSSFESLKKLPVQFVKIDGSFIKDIVESTVDQRLVQSMVEMAHGTGKRVIAEYVGDARTLELLRAMGVDYAQGYYIGKPRPVATLA